MLGQEASLERLETRVNLVLQVQWVLQAHWDQRACRGKEAEPDQLVLWGNVVQPAMLANQVLWVQWEFWECQVFPVTQDRRVKQDQQGSEEVQDSKDPEGMPVM